MSRVDTWMPLYIGDYLGDTLHLDTLAHGAYLLLLMHYWRNGPLLDDDRALSAIAKMKREDWIEIAPMIREFFSLEGERLHHKRADKERAAATGLSNRRQEAGTKGAKVRWQSHGNRMAIACESHCDSHAPLKEDKKEGKDSHALPARASRLPADWLPSPDDVRYANERGLDPLETAEKFRSHFHAIGGDRAVRVDWGSAWRKWCCDEPGFAPRFVPRVVGGRGGGVDKTAYLDRYMVGIGEQSDFIEGEAAD